MSAPDATQRPVRASEAQKLFDFLSTHPLSPGFLRQGHFHEADAVLAFCRVDPLIAEAAVVAYQKGLAPVVVFTGGVGNDSGPVLTEWGVAEAIVQAALACHAGVPRKAIVIEPDATNGGENSRLGYTAVWGHLGDTPSRLILVLHATSLRRLTEVLLTIAEQEGWPPLELQVCATTYRFDPNDLGDPDNPGDRAEAAAEILKLAEWPYKFSEDTGLPWLRPQPDLPADLVAIARRIVAEQAAA